MSKKLVFTGKASGLQDISIPQIGALAVGEKVTLHDEERADRWVAGGNFEYADDESAAPATPAAQQASEQETPAAVDNPSPPAVDAGIMEGDA